MVDVRDIMPEVTVLNVAAIRLIEKNRHLESLPPHILFDFLDALQEISIFIIENGSGIEIPKELSKMCAECSETDCRAKKIIGTLDAKKATVAKPKKKEYDFFWDMEDL